MVGVLARVLGVVVLRTCGDGIWVHLGVNLTFGSFWFGLEMVKSKEGKTGIWLAEGSATAPSVGRYSATCREVGRFVFLP